MNVPSNWKAIMWGMASSIGIWHDEHFEVHPIATRVTNLARKYPIEVLSWSVSDFSLLNPLLMMKSGCLLGYEQGYCSSNCIHISVNVWGIWWHHSCHISGGSLISLNGDHYVTCFIPVFKFLLEMLTLRGKWWCKLWDCLLSLFHVSWGFWEFNAISSI